jgi:hypothetical protein
VTRRTPLPSREDVQLAIKQLTDTTGKPPTVLSLATNLGLANTTFRRNFPDITADLTHQRTPPSTHPKADDITPFQRLQQENAQLRITNHDLTEHLELAIANIQRLTMENHDLRQQLEAATGITRIHPGLQPSPDNGRRGSATGKS